MSRARLRSWAAEERDVGVNMALTSDGRTLLTVRDQFASKEDLDGMVDSGMESGARESYERLDEVLAELKKK